MIKQLSKQKDKSNARMKHSCALRICKAFPLQNGPHFHAELNLFSDDFFHLRKTRLLRMREQILILVRNTVSPFHLPYFSASNLWLKSAFQAFSFSGYFSDTGKHLLLVIEILTLGVLDKSQLWPIFPHSLPVQHSLVGCSCVDYPDY